MVRAVTPIPFVKARFFDRCGKPLTGGKVYTYEANTTTAKTTYKDPYGLTPNTNPIILDAAGEADIYLDGTYRIRITDRNDVLVNDVEKIGSWFSDNLQDTLDNISGAMDDALKPILQNLDEAINAAAAAGAGANGWTTDLVEENGLTQKQINAAQKQINAAQKAKNSEFVSVKDFGAKGDGVANDTQAFKDAAAAGETIFIPAGDYIVNDSIDFGEKMHVTFDPNAKVIANGSYSKNAVFVAKGNAQQTAKLSANAAKGALSIMLTNTTGLQSGDLLCIFNPTNGSWSKFRDNYKAGEFVLVSSVSSNTVNLIKPLFDSYNIGDVDIYKITPCSVNLNNPSIESNGAALGLIKAEYALNPVVNNPKLSNSNNNCLAFIRSVNGNINGNDIRNYGNGGDDYGLVFGNSQGFTVTGGNYYARRHATASGGDADVCCVPCRDIKYIGCDISNDINSAVYSADMHGNAEFVRYINCNIKNGATLQGANNDLINNHIYGGILGGSAIYTAEILGGKFDIKGNTFECFKDPSDTNRGVVDFGGNTLAISDKTTRDVTINFKGNTVNSDKFSAITNIITVRNRGTDKKININSQNNTLNVNALNTVVYIDKISGNADTDYLISDNNTSNVVGAFSIICGADYLALNKLRCQATVWVDTVTINTTMTAVTGIAKTFTWRFPKNPCIFTNNGDNGYVGTKVPITKAISVTGQKATLWLSNSDASNFAANTTVRLYGRAEICEV